MLSKLRLCSGNVIATFIYFKLLPGSWQTSRIILELLCYELLCYASIDLIKLTIARMERGILDVDSIPKLAKRILVTGGLGFLLLLLQLAHPRQWNCRRRSREAAEAAARRRRQGGARATSAPCCRANPPKNVECRSRGRL